MYGSGVRLIFLSMYGSVQLKKLRFKSLTSPEDKLDESLRLIAVIGSKINTYGIKDISIKMGGKT